MVRANYTEGMDLDRHRVHPDRHFRLADVDPNDNGGLDKAAGREQVTRLNQRLGELQELLWADGRHRVLLVLQGMDACGKDGTIRTVFQGVNPQGVPVTSFKQPSDEELAHDYLWRVHDHAPASGELAIFNRSHYEDVLVVRVEGLVPEERWRRRYRHIMEFERMLAEEGTTIVKIFLHISKEEQRIRQQERIDNPKKRWKFSSGDLAARAKWDQYMDAFQDMLDETSTEFAPWYVVPANRNWYRDLVVSSVLVHTLESLALRYPEPEAGLEGLVVE